MRNRIQNTSTVNETISHARTTLDRAIEAMTVDPTHYERLVNDHVAEQRKRLPPDLPVSENDLRLNATRAVSDQTLRELTERKKAAEQAHAEARAIIEHAERQALAPQLPPPSEPSESDRRLVPDPDRPQLLQLHRVFDELVRLGVTIESQGLSYAELFERMQEASAGGDERRAALFELQFVRALSRATPEGASTGEVEQSRNRIRHTR